ncbi:hypothetical protein [Mesobacillus sp. S13]|uniref:hypothetical protein n=1 Tax=Mesobacillus sp. S13 TaxID=2880221 RepID=UPI001CF16608|nr:hypothetical protein [Mesobacillus sp. S13]
MTTTIALDLVDEIPPNGDLPPSQSLLQQYEKMIVTTLLRSFALDLMFKDQDGGNIDTPVTAREFGLKDEAAQTRYQNRGDYQDKRVKNKYHQHANYSKRNAEASSLRKDGKLIDSYTGQKMPRNEAQDMDHTIAASTIHNDPAVYLTNLNGVDLANADTNLNHTNFSINRSKKHKDMKQFINELEKNQAASQSRINELKKKGDLSDKERGELRKLENLSKANIEMMAEADKKARKAYEGTIRTAYLKDKETWKKLKTDAASQGMRMGLRQVVGMLLAEVWMIVRRKFPQIVSEMKEEFSLSTFLKQVGETFKEAFTMVKEKFSSLIKSFGNGVLAGIMASLSTFIVNLFAGTAKNVVKLIREFWGSITEIFSLLVFNRDQLAPGDLMKAISKIIVMAASVAAGTFIGEAFSKLPIAQMPVIGEPLTIFIGGMTTGILSVSLLYFIDHSKEVAELVTFLNKFEDQLVRKIEFYQQLNVDLQAKVSELAALSLDELHAQIELVNKMSSGLSLATSPDEANEVVTRTIQEMRLDLPYEDRDQLKGLLRDKSVTLHFG